MKKVVLFMLVFVFYVHLINNEIIKARSVERGKFDAEYRIVTITGEHIRVPFTSILKIIEEK